LKKIQISTETGRIPYYWGWPR